MTTEPTFIPEKAVTVDLSGGGSFRARLIQAADETKEMYNRFRNEVLS